MQLLKLPAEMKAEVIFIILPILLMAMIKVNNEGLGSVFLAPDWSLVSCILFGQTSYTITTSVVNSKHDLRGEKVGLYITMRIFLFGLSLTSYVLMTTFANIYLGVIQAIFFFAAIRFYIKDKFLAKLLIGKNTA